VLIVSGIPVLYFLVVRLGWVFAERTAQIRRVYLHAAVMSSLVTATIFAGHKITSLWPGLTVFTPESRTFLGIDGAVISAAVVMLIWTAIVRLAWPNWRWQTWREAVVSLAISVPVTLILVGLVRRMSEAQPPLFDTMAQLVLRQLTVGAILTSLAGLLLLAMVNWRSAAKTSRIQT
jgi:hypothetical protein